MMQLGGEVSEAERLMSAKTRAILEEMHFQAYTADNIRATSNYLVKLVDLIRGCGFGIAIYSDQTPARTVGNIFFEVGVSLILGKSVQLVFAGNRPTPSDFMRTEWIEYEPGKEDIFIRNLRDSCKTIEEMAGYYRTLGALALEAQEVDLELAFERCKQVS